MVPITIPAVPSKIDLQPTAPKINKIIVSSANPATSIAKDLFKQGTPLTITTTNGNLLGNQSTVLSANPSTVLTTDNNSYQLVFTTVAKSHPRIKYSGLKKNDDKAIILETNPGTNILDISSITPLISSSLGPMTTTYTLPSTTQLSGNSQIININTNDLTSIKYADLDDIELPDGTKIGYQTDMVRSNEATTAEKYSIMVASTLENLDFSLAETVKPAASAITTTTTTAHLHHSSVSESTNEDDNGEELFACRHCGKKYRWKSTLRRHENDECGNKEPSHQCPYCPYKAKQRGNLGVHVRKHHANMPQLESKRKKKD